MMMMMMMIMMIIMGAKLKPVMPIQILRVSNEIHKNVDLDADPFMWEFFHGFLKRHSTPTHPFIYLALETKYLYPP